MKLNSINKLFFPPKKEHNILLLILLILIVFCQYLAHIYALYSNEYLEQFHTSSFKFIQEFSRFTIRCATSDWLRRGQNPHCIMGKCQQIKCCAIRNYTWVCFKWPKMWIKRLHAKIHNIITIYIHYKTIYFKTITWIILIIAISNVFACKTNSVFNDFVNYCVTGKCNITGVCAL